METLEQSQVVDPNNEIKIVVILPTNAYFLSGVRDFTMNFVKNITKFSEKWSFRFQSIVDELVSNAVEHGSSVKDEVKLTLLSKKGFSMEVIVEDNGHGKDKVSASQLKELYEKKKQALSLGQFQGIRGRGLVQIVAPWSDELLFEDSPTGGIIIRAIKYLKKEDQVEVVSGQQSVISDQSFQKNIV